MSAKRFFYDDDGDLSAETQPFIWGDPEFPITYVRDLLGRPLEVKRPLSEQYPSQLVATTFVYDRLSIWQTTPGNPGNQTTETVTDAIDRIVRVNDSLGGSSYYEYNAFDQLTKTTDPSGHITTVGFDNRGDRLSVQTCAGRPHASTPTDPETSVRAPP
jgi:YD repeat-containing protein